MNIKGTIVSICISPTAKSLMMRVPEVRTITGRGLEGDRYATGEGSFNKGEPGKRQVTLMNATFLPKDGFEDLDTGRNIICSGIEINRLISREFKIGEVKFRAINYCPPCNSPNKRAGAKIASGILFKKSFHDNGGIIAEVLSDGIIKVGDEITADLKDYS